MSQNSRTQNVVITNMFWRFAERFGAQIVAFVVSIVLARLLDPEHYGTIALITVFISILQVFIDAGIGNALIQKKDADQLDFSTVFFFNIVFCIFLYGLLFEASPLIAAFYKNSGLIPVIRVLGITILISGLKNIQQAFVSRHMLFKKFFFSTLCGTICAAIIGIAMAYLGYGVWALVAQQIINISIDTLVLWFTVKWRPTKEFSYERLKGLLSYGWKLTASALIEVMYDDLRQLIIGKVYSSADLAYFNKGKHIPRLMVVNINNSMDSVLFPVLSRHQDEPQAIRSMMRKAIRTSSYIIWPIMIGIAATAEPLVRLLMTEKWLGSVPIMRVFCFSYALFPIQTANLNAIKAVGRSDIFLKLEIMKKIVGLTLLGITCRFGVMAMVYSFLVSAIISSVINAYPNKHLLNYSYVRQIADIMPSVLLASGMGAVVYMISFIGLNDAITLIVQIVVGVVVYTLGSIVLKIDSYEFVKSYVSRILRKIIHK